jgi:flavoprotein
MSWFNRSKNCAVCEDKYLKSVPFHEIQMNTDEGMVSLEICDKCADFFDKSADVIMKGRSNDTLRLREIDQLDQKELDERYGE